MQNSTASTTSTKLWPSRAKKQSSTTNSVSSKDCSPHITSRPKNRTKPTSACSHGTPTTSFSMASSHTNLSPWNRQQRRWTGYIGTWTKHRRWNLTTSRSSTWAFLCPTWLSIRIRQRHHLHYSMPAHCLIREDNTWCLSAIADKQTTTSSSRRYSISRARPRSSLS